MKSKLFPIITILLGVILISTFGGITIPANIPTDGVFTNNQKINLLIGASGTLIGVFLIISSISRLTFAIRRAKISSLLEKHQGPSGVAFSVLAQEMNSSQEKMLSLIHELIHFNYVSRIFIDYINEVIRFLDSEGVDADSHINFISTKCSTCGGTNTARKGSTYACEYCGNESIAEGESENIIHTQSKSSKTVNKTLMENVRLGCGFPIAIVLLYLYISALRGSIAGISSLSPLMLIIAIPLFIIMHAIPGYFLVRSFYKSFRAFNEKRTRPLMTRYLAGIVHTRTPEGISIKDFSALLKEPVETTEKNLQLLIKRKLLVGVSYDNKNGIIKYMDDDVNFDRFVSVSCKNCGGEFVATYGKDNICPYCGNGLPLSKIAS